jgi:predicted permease
VQEVDPGFSSDNVLTAQIALPASRYPDAPARTAFWGRLVEAARSLPGVTAAGLTSNVPFNGMVGSGTYRIVGHTPAPGESLPHGRQEVVGGDYFAAMRIPLVRGRLFTDADGADAPRVTVIDEYLVHKYFRDRDPIGQQIRRGGPTSPAITIVGVVGTINSIDLAEPVTKERLYYPVAQVASPSMAVVLKTAADPTTLVAPLRAAVKAIDPGQAMADVRTLDQWIGRSLATRRAPTVVLTLFGAVAVLLSAIGIYGVVAFGVAGRTREFAIRQALGAAPDAIVRLVLRQGVATAGIGVGLGVAGAAVLARYLESLVYGVSVRDAGVLTAAAGLLLVAALVACYLPAKRSTRRDPALALRDA